MNNLTIAAQTIKENVSALDVGEALGLEIRHGRCKCPIHNGDDFNCVLYRGNRGYYCHVCKAGGDVISFVQKYYSMSFKDCARYFNDTFHLGLNIDTPMSQEAVKQAEMAQRKRKEEREHRAWKERCQFEIALAADKLVSVLEEVRDRNVPKTADEEWNKPFCDAIRTLPEARRFAEDCMYNCVEVKE